MPLIDSYAHNREFHSMDRVSQWFYLNLRTILDPTGRYDADPRILNSTLFPLRTDVRDTDITRWLHCCERAGLLRCYVDPKRRPVVEVFDAKQVKLKQVSKYGPRDPQPDLLPPDGIPRKRSEVKRSEDSDKSAATKLCRSHLSEKREEECRGEGKPAKPLSGEQWRLARGFEDALGPEWTNDAGKWINRIKSDIGKSARVLNEIVSAGKEQRIRTTAAAFAEECWKEFA